MGLREQFLCSQSNHQKLFLLFVQGHGIREITSIEYKMGHLERRSEDMVKSRIFWAQKELQYILRQYGITGKNHKGKGND